LAYESESRTPKNRVRESEWYGFASTLDLAVDSGYKNSFDWRGEMKTGEELRGMEQKKSDLPERLKES